MQTKTSLVLLACAAFATPQALVSQSHSSNAKRGNTIVETAVSAGKFKTLVAAVKAAGLAGVLSGRGPFTVFAPTDAAFAKLPKGTIATLLKPENKQQLVDILKLHVVKGRVDSTTALRVAKAPTLLGEKVEVRLDGGRLKVGAANVVANDVSASNGIIHVIDSVLLPTPKKATGARGLIEFAIETGAPLYNKGQREACAAIYELCARSLLLSKETSSASKKRIRSLIPTLAKKSAMDRAWALRDVLDSAWDAMDRASTRAGAR